MKYTTRPLSDRTWLRPAAARVGSRFDSTWTQTLQLLEREIDLLDGRDVVIEVDVREQDLRLDGTLRAKARAESPAVVVAFESKHGPQLHRCDKFVAKWHGQVDWQHNVRAIALTLEALRDMDRWGAVETGQQYAGFKALPAGHAMPASHMTSEAAWSLLRQQATRRVSPDVAAVMGAHELVKHARRAAHPDHNGGDHTIWDQVEQAAAVLGVGR
ncbi:hypothetical protein QWY28_13410 [Nocardioides sp. SOB77]|uniref:Molecular chaperone DnaJ n=1 Tax=Nocardioides oceani TaxID=3058369 RepID=A0ABT8FH04_9ACTN|nr:hypothetical protein [Nocardioides oceani]MDN4173953.1 hypothetical protein [Nocardioides oceani]